MQIFTKYWKIDANIYKITLQLRKIPKFHLNFWCGFFANHPKLVGNCAFPQNFNTRKLGEI